MRGSHEKRVPQELACWLALENSDWQPSYTFPSDIRSSVVKALCEAQRGLCVYCGRRLLQRSFHIEHFRPQSSYPSLSVDIANLYLSCGPEDSPGNPSKTCGRVKGGRFDETNCVEPDYPACAHRFRFLLTGEASPQSVNDAAAEKMIELLNLNHPELRKDREDILNLVDGGNLDLSDFINPTSGAVYSYAHVVCEHLGTTIP